MHMDDFSKRGTNATTPEESIPENTSGPGEAPAVPLPNGEALPDQPARAPRLRLEDLDADEVRSLVAANCPPPWSLDSERHRILTSEGLPLCGPIAVLGRFRDRDGQSWSRLVVFIDLDGRPQILLVPNTQIEGSGRGALLSMLADRGLWMSGQGAGITALIKAWETSRRGTIVHRAGWVEDDCGRRAYVLPRGGTIARPDDDDIIVLAGAPLGRRPATAGTLAGWQAGIGQLALGNPVMMMMICVALSGPLLAACRLSMLGFNYFGATSRGKTSGVKAALSVLPDYPPNPPRWTATNTGLELMAARQTDGLLALDEFPTDPRPGVITMLMGLGNATGCARGTGQLTLREQTHSRFAVLSTAEYPLTQILEKAGRTPPPGLSVRLVDVPAERRHGAFDELHGMTGHQFAKSLHEHAQANFGHVGPGFVQWLLARSRSEIDRISEVQVAIHRKLKERLGLQDCPEIAERVLDAFSVVAAAGELAIKAGLLPWPKHSASEAVQVMAAEWWRHRIRPQALTDLLREIEDLTDLLPPLHEDIAFIGLDSAAGAPLGWADETSLYLLPQAFTHMDREADRHRSIRLLDDAGVVMRGTERSSLQQKITLPGTRRRERVYKLDRAIISRLLATTDKHRDRNLGP